VVRLLVGYRLEACPLSCRAWETKRASGVHHWETRFYNETDFGFVLKPDRKLTMSSAVKISDIEMIALREAAALQSRSLSGQAEHWLRLGRAFERDPRYGYAKVEQALKGLVSPDLLNDSEQEDYFVKLSASYWEPSPAEDAFFADMRARGEGVGMDEAGNIIVAAPIASKS